MGGDPPRGKPCHSTTCREQFGCTVNAEALEFRVKGGEERSAEERRGEKPVPSACVLWQEQPS